MTTNPNPARAAAEELAQHIAVYLNGSDASPAAKLEHMIEMIRAELEAMGAAVSLLRDELMRVQDLVGEQDYAAIDAVLEATKGAGE